MLSLMPNTIFALHCSSAFGHTSTGAIALPFRCYPYSLGSFRVGLTIPLCFPFSCSPSLRWTVPLSCSALIDFSMTFCQTSPLTTVVHCQRPPRRPCGSQLKTLQHVTPRKVLFRCVRFMHMMRDGFNLGPLTFD